MWSCIKEGGRERGKEDGEKKKDRSRGREGERGREGGRGRGRRMYVNNIIGEHVSVIMRIGGKLCGCK